MEKQILKVGDRFQTTRYGEIEVIAYRNARDVDVIFSDGTVQNAFAANIRKGSVGHPTSGILVGYKFVNGDGCIGEVVHYHDCHNIDVKWEDDIITSGHSATGVKRASITYPNFRSLSGVGYFGIGDYLPARGVISGSFNPRVYASWQRMITRCYNEREQMKSSCKAYIGVKVCDEWHCFQNFAKWAEDKQDKFVVGFDLDKDLFGDGWTYSPEVCTLLPSNLNGFLADRFSSKPSGLPDGVNVITPKKNATIGYVARCHVNGKREYLGFYKTPEEAGKVYAVTKIKEAKRLAEEYRHILTEREYEKLSNFTLEDINRKPR